LLNGKELGAFAIILA